MEKRQKDRKKHRDRNNYQIRNGLNCIYMKKIGIATVFYKVSLLTVVFIVFISAESLMSQTVYYSQFFNNQIYYNPAYVGKDLGLRIRLNHRNQWNNLPNNYDNYAFAIDVSERKIPGAGGVGLIVQSDFDGIGNIRINSATLATAARIPISMNVLTQFGVSFSFVQKEIDYSSFVFSDQLDPRYGVVRETNFIPPQYNSVSYPDFGFGMLLQFFESSRRIKAITGTLSASLQHAFRPNISFTGNTSRLPYKLVFMGDVLLDNEPGRVNFQTANNFFYKLNPGFLFEKQDDISNFLIGTNAYKNQLYAGVWLRSQNFTYAQVNDLIWLIGIYVPMGESSRIKLMYSYDYVISDLRRSIGATHELSVVFELDGFNIFGDPSRAGSARNRMLYGCPECPPF